MTDHSTKLLKFQDQRGRKCWMEDKVYRTKTQSSTVGKLTNHARQSMLHIY